MPTKTENEAVKVKYFDKNTNPNGDDTLNLNRFPGGEVKETGLEIPAGMNVGEAVIFQDYLRVPISDTTNNKSYFKKVNVKDVAGTTSDSVIEYNPIDDHLEDSDESIGNISQLGITTKN